MRNNNELILPMEAPQCTVTINGYVYWNVIFSYSLEEYKKINCGFAPRTRVRNSTLLPVWSPDAIFGTHFSPYPFSV